MADPCFTIDSHTETAGTAIVDVIPPVDGMIPRLTNIVYESAGTAHTLTVMRCVATTATDVSAEASQNLIEVTDLSSMKNPSSGTSETLASSDYIVIQNEIGQYEVHLVSSVSLNVLTLTSTLAQDVQAGAPVWIFGEVGRAVHSTILTKASTLHEITGHWQGGTPGQKDAYTGRTGTGDPLLLYSDNSTAAGTLRTASGIYVSGSNLAYV